MVLSAQPFPSVLISFVFASASLLGPVPSPPVVDAVVPSVLFSFVLVSEFGLRRIFGTC